MSADTNLKTRANLIGSLWMISAMAAFAVEDSLLKMISGDLPLGQILVVFGFVGSLVFTGLVLRNGERLYSPAVTSKPMLYRVFFEVMGRLFYVLAVTLTPLSSATAILQAAPLVVVAGAAVLFGERVAWRRWLAIVIGMCGVMIIIRPGTESFSVLSILAVLGLIGLSGRDLASRAAPLSLSTSVLGLYGFLSLFVTGAAFSVWQGLPYLVPSLENTGMLAGLVVVGVFAYSCLMKAMRTGDVSAVTPFRYSRLLFGVGLGVMLFDEKLDLWMMVGSALIVVSGLFIVWRSKKVQQSSA